MTLAKTGYREEVQGLSILFAAKKTLNAANNSQLNPVKKKTETNLLK